MSKTIIHKSKARFKNGIDDIGDVPYALRQQWNRHNSEKSFFVQRRNKVRYKNRKDNEDDK